MEIAQDNVSLESGTSELPTPAVGSIQDNAPIVEPISNEAISQAQAPVAPEMDKAKEEQKLKNIAQTVAKAMVEESSTEVKGLLNLTTFGAGAVEDMYNFGIDAVNYADRKFGDGKDLLEYSERISMFQPQDTGSVMARSSLKLLIGYSQLLKGMTALTGKQVGLARLSNEAAAGFFSEMVLLKPQGEPLLKQFLKKVPVKNEWMDFIHTDGDASGMEKRLENSLYGVVEGGLVGGLMKTARFMRSVYLADSSMIKKMVSNQRGSAGGNLPPEVPSSTPPSTLPSGAKLDDAVVSPEAMAVGVTKGIRDLDLPPVIDREQSESILTKYLMGEGNPNTAAVGNNRPAMDLTTMNVEDESRKMINLVVENNQEFFEKLTVTQPELVKLAKEMDLTPQKLLDMEVSLGIPKGTILATKAVINEAAAELKSLAKRKKEGMISMDDFQKGQFNFEELLGKFDEMRNLSGSLLREMQESVGTLNSVQKTKDMARLYGDDSESLVEALTRPETTVDQVKQAFKNVMMDVPAALTQIRYAGLLSSPKTHLRNIYGGVTTTLTRPAESVLAATINSIPGMRAGARGTQFGEAYHELLGMAHGTFEALTLASKKMRGQDVTFSGVDPKTAKLPQYLSSNKTAPKSKGGKFLTHLVETLGSSKVGSLLQLEDDIIKHVNARMTLSREAFLKGSRARMAKASPEEVAEIIRKELNDPSKKTQGLMYRDAEYSTFTNEIDGPMFKQIEAATSSPLGKLIAPFAKTNLNVMSYTLERIPGANLLVAKSRRELTSKNPAIRQRAIAKLAFSSMTMTGLAALLHSQDALIGSGSANPTKRKFLEANGYQLNSIRFGDEWVEFRRETPLGAILGTIADIAELNDALPDDEKQVTADLGNLLVATIAQVYNPAYLTDGMAKLGEAFANPSKKAGKAALNYGAGLASSFLPYSALIREVNRNIGDGTKRETYDPSSLLNTTMAKAMDIYAPYLNARKRTILGDPILHKQGLGSNLISPFGLTPESKDPVLNELARLQDVGSISSGLVKEEIKLGSDSTMVVQNLEEGTFPMPSKTIIDPIAKQPTKLGPMDYEKLLVLSAGLRFKEGDSGLELLPEPSTSLRQTLKMVISQDAYKNSSDAVKIDIIKPVISKYRKIGQQLLFFKDKDFSSKYREIAKEVKIRMNEVYKD